jgi:hypothetical protein
MTSSFPAHVAAARSVIEELEGLSRRNDGQSCAYQYSAPDGVPCHRVTRRRGIIAESLTGS